MRTQNELQADRLSTTRPAAGGGRAVPVSGSHFWGHQRTAGNAERPIIIIG